MDAAIQIPRRSMRDEWNEQSIRVLITRAQTARDSAYLHMASHSLAEQRPTGTATIPELTRHAAELRHHFNALLRARAQIGDALDKLNKQGVPPDLGTMYDAVELSCADLDAYIERSLLAESIG